MPTGSAYASWRISRSGSGYKLLPQVRQRQRKTRSDRPVHRHLEVVQQLRQVLELVLPSGSRRGLPRLAVPGQTGQQRADRQHGSRWRTTSGRGAVGDADLVAPERRPGPGRGRPAVRGSAPGLLRQLRLRHLRHHGLPGLRRDGQRDRRRERGRRGHRARDRHLRRQARLTQFTSSNGGQITTGDYRYQIAQTDPYDGVIKSQTWSKTITASRLGSAVRVGTAKRVQITKRDGDGAWGGRVTTDQDHRQQEDGHGQRHHLQGQVRHARRTTSP